LAICRSIDATGESSVSAMRTEPATRRRRQP
jgi:hypothetical protein